MMEAQLARDWADLHQPLVARHPDVLGGLTLRDYRWALSTVWSRAVGAERGRRCDLFLFFLFGGSGGCMWL